MTLNDFLDTMELIDESDYRYETGKFAFLIKEITDLYYYETTPNALFRQYCEAAGYFDIHRVEEAYKTLFDQLDRYSYYLTPEESKAFLSASDYKGIGAVMKYYEADESHPLPGVYVDRIVKGSPAEGVWLKEGDRLVSLEGFSVEYLPLAAVSGILASVEDGQRFLTLETERREDGIAYRYPYKINRKEVDTPSTSLTEYPEDGAFRLTIDSFMSGSVGDDAARAVHAMAEKGYRKAILDLRNNGGGNVREALDVISLFLPEPQLIFTMGKKSDPALYPYYSSRIGVPFDAIIVLVNGNTASAAEITAYCLKTLQNAVIVGERTVGKAVAQTLIPITDGSTVGITTYEVYNSEGETYNLKGILPDHVISDRIDPSDFFEKAVAVAAADCEKGILNGDPEAILALEQRLCEIGYLAEADADGVFDTVTENAMKIFAYMEGENAFNTVCCSALWDAADEVASRGVVFDSTLAFALDYLRTRTR